MGVSADFADKPDGAGRSAGVSADIGSASLPPVSAGETLSLSFLFDCFFLASGDTLPSLSLSLEQSLIPLSSLLDSYC